MEARLARRGLIVLTAINLVNYLDRYVPAALGPSLRAALSLSDTQFGLLTSGFIVVYMLAAPVFGALGDRGARPRLIALGIFAWSLATALGGLAWSFASLLAARAAVGIGEAAYGTIAPTLLADYYAPPLRGRIFSVFYAAIPIGSALSYVLSGQLDAHFGWRSAFLVAGFPGVLLALLALGLEDPPRGARETEALVPPSRGAYGTLAHNRPYVLTVLGYAAYTFALGGMAAFMPMFLTRVRGLPAGTATAGFGGILVVTGFVGTAIGGWIGDSLLRYTRQAYLWVSGVATVAAAPLVLVGLTSPTPPVYWGSIVAAEVLLFASTGPINSAIINAVAPSIRATAVAASILAIHIFGDVPSPTILGALSDHTSLGQAVLIIPVAVLVGGIVWTYGAWSGGREARLPAPAA
ncbi:MAG TPA: MFS transporter [Gemmatimonadales bacterium]|nr:MFS transporter [Gemmatimonadales bacterium]